jgi:hypothetical protein
MRLRSIAIGPGKLLNFAADQRFLEQTARNNSVRFSPSTTFDAYNPTSFFMDQGNTVIGVRSEPQDNQFGSTVAFFALNPDGSHRPYETKPFRLQDPFITPISTDETLFGGVELVMDKENSDKLDVYRTVFYRGTSINSFEQFATGPSGMKDIRPLIKRSGKINVYPRPQHGEAYPGQISFVTLDSLDQLNDHELLTNAPLLKTRYPAGEWGGANQVQEILEGAYEGWNLILAHRAYYDEKRNKHYVLTAAVHDGVSAESEFIDLGVISERRDFPFPDQHPKVSWKVIDPNKPGELEDVAFAADLKIVGNLAYLTAGLGDKYIGIREIPNPLLRLPQRKSGIYLAA